MVVRTNYLVEHSMYSSLTLSALRVGVVSWGHVDAVKRIRWVNQTTSIQGKGGSSRKGRLAFAFLPRADVKAPASRIFRTNERDRSRFHPLYDLSHNKLTSRPTMQPEVPRY